MAHAPARRRGHRDGTKESNHHADGLWWNDVISDAVGWIRKARKQGVRNQYRTAMGDMLVETPAHFEASLIDKIAGAIRQSRHTVQSRRLGGHIPYTKAEEIGLFVSQLRTAMLGFGVTAGHKRLLDIFIDSSNYSDIGVPASHSLYRWNFQLDGGFSLHPARASSMLKAAMEKALAIGYDEDQSMKEIDALIASATADQPRLAAMVTELEVLNREHEGLTASLLELNAIGG